MKQTYWSDRENEGSRHWLCQHSLNHPHPSQYTTEPSLPQKPGRPCPILFFTDMQRLYFPRSNGDERSFENRSAIYTFVTVNRNGICFVHVAFLLLSFYMKRMVEIEKRQMSLFKYKNPWDDLNLTLSSKLRILRLLIIICSYW